MRVVLYARVSTDDKDQDPARQITPCKNYASMHNHEIVEIITEHHTGDSHPLDRPEGKRIRDINPQGILVYSMDRFTRQHPIKVLQLLNEMKDRGVLVISISEPIFNMESEMSEPLRFFMAWFNNWFLTKLKKDINSGIQHARLHGTKSGKPIGREPKAFNKYRAAELLKQGVSFRTISKELGVSPATVFRFKTSPDFLGGKYINEPSVLEAGVSGTVELSK